MKNTHNEELYIRQDNLSDKLFDKSSIFLILKNVNVVRIVMAVTKKEPKRKHTQKQSFVIPTVNRLNFRKLNISKKKCGNAIK